MRQPRSQDAPALSVSSLKDEASKFSLFVSQRSWKDLYGVTDGKAIGTWMERKFTQRLMQKYSFTSGNSAFGIDFPELNVDLKTTSIRQPQSSCPFRSPRQKVYGLGYSLLIFAYDKEEKHDIRSSKLWIRHAIFVEQERTADFQTTSGILSILDNHGNVDDLIAFFQERNLPLDDIQANQLAQEILRHRPLQGFLTISNALQWRLQYSRVIDLAGNQDGIQRL